MAHELAERLGSHPCLNFGFRLWILQQIKLRFIINSQKLLEAGQFAFHDVSLAA